jgi:hypothetical protein
MRTVRRSADAHDAREEAAHRAGELAVGVTVHAQQLGLLDTSDLQFDRGDEQHIAKQR